MLLQDFMLSQPTIDPPPLSGTPLYQQGINLTVDTDKFVRHAKCTRSHCAERMGTDPRQWLYPTAEMPPGAQDLATHAKVKPLKSCERHMSWHSLSHDCSAQPSRLVAIMRQGAKFVCPGTHGVVLGAHR